jgi:putative glutamine amidotransferase
LSGSEQLSVIGVPLRPFAVADSPPKLALNRAYFEALESAGATPLAIPVVHDVDRLRFYYNLLDGLLLPGGADVEPHRYGAVARTDANLDVMPELDEMELTLAGWAIADGLPVLAICRGIQVLNVACGGTLWQDIQVEGATTSSHYREPRDEVVHTLDIEVGSLLARTVRATSLRVNSLHHQAIREIGPSLRVVAHSPDGLIEGVELPSHDFVLGIQCHPEELSRKEPWAARLFSGLAAAAGARREREPVARR